jgi:hypothetical protein
MPGVVRTTQVVARALSDGPAVVRVTQVVVRVLSTVSSPSTARHVSLCVIT